MAASIDNSAWLEWMNGLMGGMSRQTYAATFPSDRFYCLLDELPLHLLPKASRGLLRVREEDLQNLVLNPDCEFRTAGSLPEDLTAPEEILSVFALQGTIAWVRDKAHESLLPFWLGAASSQAIRNARSGMPILACAPKHVLAVLAAAGILIPRNGLAGEQMIVEAAALFRAKDYAPLPGLIHPFQVAALRRYYRHLIRSGKIHFGDAQSPLRYVVHNEPVARFFHRQILGRLNSVAGEPLKPSYVYLASYLGGAELKKHTDRAQCEFSITLCLDFSPEPELASPWPIRLDTQSATVVSYQALGDGLAYRGTRVPHYRDALPAGQTSTSIFFHYVAADFNGPLT